jgi:hypothetical protein
MLRYQQVTTTRELIQVLELQFGNLKQHLSPAEKEQEGFVTLQHSLEMLTIMHTLQPSVIAVDEGNVIGYALVMDPACRALVPLLDPLFGILETISFRERPLPSYRFYIMGQVCIDKAYRGKGVFAGLYHKHRDLFSKHYDIVITEISSHNHRSLRAHEKIGFREIHRHAGNADEWVVVGWDFS